MPCLLLSLLIGAVSVPRSDAAELDTPADVKVMRGKTVRIPLPIRHGQGPRIEVRLGEAPDGARLVLEDNGELVLEWSTDPGLPVETRIELRVMNLDTGENLESVFATVRRQNPSPSPSPLQEPVSGSEMHPGSLRGPASAPEPGVGQASEPESHSAPGVESEVDSPSSLAPVVTTVSESRAPGSSLEIATGQDGADLQVPQLPPLPNQVVSAGRTVKIPVMAELSGPGSAVLLIDRLPRRASFEANAAGGRTFRWETGDSDQGEHLFRITAFNSRNPQLRSSREVLVIVGDPSRGVTSPD